MNVLRFIVNSNTNLAQPVKLPDNSEIKEESNIIEKYENRIQELEDKIKEQEIMINELRRLLYNQQFLTN